MLYQYTTDKHVNTIPIATISAHCCIRHSRLNEVSTIARNTSAAIWDFFECVMIVLLLVNKR